MRDPAASPDARNVELLESYDRVPDRHPVHRIVSFEQRVSVVTTFYSSCRLWGIPHNRHTCATLALEQGVHPRVVQERLGHATIRITLGIYSHVSPTLHDEAAQAIADLMLPLASEGS